MKAKIEKTSELSKLLSVKTRMSDDLFHLFGKFGIGHLLSRLSLEKQNGVSASQATCSLVYSLTCLLTMLLCLLFTLSTNNLLTCLLVDLSTYHVTLSFIYPVYKQLVYLSTYLLVYFSTKKLLYLAFSINFAIFANCLIHMYHMFVEIIDILYYEFKL